MLRTRALGPVAAGATGASVGIRDLRDSYVTIAGTFSATWYLEVSGDGSRWAQLDTGTAAKVVGPIPVGVNIRVRVGAGTGSVVAHIGGNESADGDVNVYNIGPVAPEATGSTFNVGTLDKQVVFVGGTFTGTWTLEVSNNGGTTWFTLDSGTAAKVTSSLPRSGVIRISLGTGTGTLQATLAGVFTSNAKRFAPPSGDFRGGAVTAHTTATTGARVVTNGLKGPQVYVNSADFVGTYFVDITMDNGTTWAPFATATVASGTTYTTHTLPRVTGFRLRSTVVTSGTLAASWSSADDR